MSSQTTPIVEVDKLMFAYTDGTKVSLEGDPFLVRPGERIVLLGPNGSGKTTLLTNIVGLYKPVAGRVSLFGLDPYQYFDRIKQRVGVVFQLTDDQIIGPTVKDDIGITVKAFMGKNREEFVTQAARQLDITHLLSKIPHYLSGGEKKKVAIGGAIAHQPDLLILDEPFDGLDPYSREELIKLLNQLNRDLGTAMIITTHDVNVLPLLADRVYIVNNNRIIDGGCPKTIVEHREQLLAARLELPILMELSYQLERRGIQLPCSGELENTVEEIMRLIIK